MSIAQMLLPEFDQEMANTRKTLERVPEDKLEWKPDPKSMSLGRLAQHIAEMPGWGSMALKQDALDLDPEGKGYTPQPLPKSRQEILDMFEKNVKESRAAIAGASDGDLQKPWSLLMNKRNLFTMPRVGVLRTFVMNHVIHHRAQLGVYFRLNGIPVPAIYGPSADEGQMGASA
jgi:uncharacterized damage-inducible protein DinB